MRDIRDDLRQRVALLRQERDQLQAQLQAKLSELDAYEAQLSSLLELEEKRLQKVIPAFILPPPPAPAPVFTSLFPSPPPPPTQMEARDASDDEFEAEILKIIGNGQPWEHSAIRKQMQASGWFLEKGSLGRALQGQLLSLKQRGEVEYLGDSKWRKLKVAAVA